MTRDARAQRISHRLQEAARHFGTGPNADDWRAVFEDLEGLERDLAARTEEVRSAHQREREITEALGEWVRWDDAESAADGIERMRKKILELRAEIRRLRVGA